MKAFIPFIFKKRLFVCLFVGFILATIVGTVSHECGHYLMAKHYGNKEVHVGYDYTNYGISEFDSVLPSIESRYCSEIKNGLDFPAKKEYIQYQNILDSQRFYLALSGPLSTMICGALGVFMLFYFRKKYKEAQELTTAQWIAVFFSSLFWLRAPFNISVELLQKMQGKLLKGSDEFRLADALHWNSWSIPVITGLTGLAVLFVVVTKFIPARLRFTFLLAGLGGGLCGACLWMELLGPIVMP